tara:strand:+ start:698 stop:1879 length:1182 start_codon:yes stop_codon:yes gene_type:complete
MTPEQMQAEMDRLKANGTFNPAAGFNPMAKFNQPMGGAMPKQFQVQQAPPQAPQQPPQPKQGLLSRLGSGIQNFVGDKEKMQDLQAMFNTMRYAPDTGIQQAYVDRQKQKRLGSTANQTVSELMRLAKNGDKLAGEAANMISANPQYAKEIYQKYVTQSLKFGGGQSAYEQAVEDGFTGTRTDFDIQMAGGGLSLGQQVDLEFDTSIAKNQAAAIEADEKLYSKGRELAASVAQLKALSPYAGTEGFVAKLGPLKNLLPEGFAGSSVDAYRQTLEGLVSALRVPGSGVITDADAIRIKSRGGSIAQSPEARAVAHAGLEAMARMQMELGELAAKFYSGGMERKDYFSQKKLILNQPLLTDAQRQAIDNLPTGNSTIGKVDANSAAAELKKRGL